MTDRPETGLPNQYGTEEARISDQLQRYADYLVGSAPSPGEYATVDAPIAAVEPSQSALERGDTRRRRLAMLGVLVVAATLLVVGLVNRGLDTTVNTIEEDDLRSVPETGSDGLRQDGGEAESVQPSSTSASPAEKASATATAPSNVATPAMNEAQGDGSVVPADGLSVETALLPSGANLIADTGAGALVALVNGSPQDAYLIEDTGTIRVIKHPFGRWHEVSQAIVSRGSLLGGVGRDGQTVTIVSSPSALDGLYSGEHVNWAQRNVAAGSGFEAWRLQGLAADGEANMLATFDLDPATGLLPPREVLEQMGLTELLTTPPCGSTVSRVPIVESGQTVGEKVVGSLDLCDGTVVPYEFDAADYPRRNEFVWLQAGPAGTETVSFIDVESALGKPFTVVMPIGIDSGFLVVAFHGANEGEMFYSADGRSWNPVEAQLGPVVRGVVASGYAYGPGGHTYAIVGTDIVRLDRLGATVVSAAPGALGDLRATESSLHGSEAGLIIIEDLGGDDANKRIWVSGDPADEWVDYGTVSGAVVFGAVNPDGAVVIVVESTGFLLHHHRITSTMDTDASLVGDGQPSQSQQAAIAQGVAPALAELPFARRVGDISGLEEYEFVEIGRATWIINELRPLDEAGSCLGPEGGEWITERVCTSSYTEMLKIVRGEDHNPIIERAYPNYSSKARWLYAVDDSIYCFRDGDGGLPNPMLCRVDLETGEYSERWWPVREPLAPIDERPFVLWQPDFVPEYLTVDPAEQPCMHDLASADPAIDSVPYLDRFLHVDPDTLELRGCEPYPAGTYD